MKRGVTRKQVFLVDSLNALQPHVYELAVRIYLLMKQRNMAQAVITWYIATCLIS